MKPDEHFYKTVLDDLSDGIYFVDTDRRITYWNKGAERLTGFKKEEVIGSRCRDNILVHVDDKVHSLCDSNCPLACTMDDGAKRKTTIFLRHKDGHRVQASVQARPIHDSGGNIVGAVEIFRDMSHGEAVQKRMEELEKLALLDPLTRLANRRHTEATLKMRIDEATRYVWPFGVLFIDVDKFKNINDTHGHEAGDMVLQLASKTMQTSLRPFDFLGRWGGDEFVAIVVNAEREGLIQVANRMQQLMEQSRFEYGGKELNVTVSIGGTVAKKNDTVKEIIYRADRLMYESKKSGRNRISTAPA